MAYIRRMRKLGHRVFLLYHVDRPELTHPQKDDFPMRAMRWEGKRLAADIKREIALFAPAIAHVWDMWSHGLAAALECSIVANARLIIHLEDDLLDVWKRRQRGAWSKKPFDLIFKGINNKAELLAMLKQCDLDACFKPGCAPQTPNFDPLLFWFAAHAADGFSAIWHPLKQRLENAFGKPVLLLPPGFENHNAKLNPADILRARTEMLASMNAPPDAILLGAGGSIRHFDGEFAAFMDAFRIAARRDPRLYLAIWGADTEPKTTAGLMKRYCLQQRVALFGAVDPVRFAELQQASDINLCAGFDSDFNVYRLASRLCLAFAMGKPILLHRAGFGESLRDGNEAVLTYTNQPAEWANKMLALAADASLRKRVSQGARRFALKHFNMDRNTRRLSDFYSAISANAAAQPDGDAFSRAAARLRQTLQTSGARRIALYGAGLHSLKLICQGWLRDFNLVGILDDAPRAKSMEGVKVFPADAASLPAWDALVVSSDTHEKILARKARVRKWRNVIKMYSSFTVRTPNKT